MSKISKYPKPTSKVPPIGELIRQDLDGRVDATDGCLVEPDGICPHGYPSWILYLGIA